MTISFNVHPLNGPAKFFEFAGELTVAEAASQAAASFGLTTKEYTFCEHLVDKYVGSTLFCRDALMSNFAPERFRRIDEVDLCEWIGD